MTKKRQSKKKGPNIYLPVHDEEVWNLDHTIAQFVLPRLKRLKKIQQGHPADLTPEAWEYRLDIMIEAFEEVLKEWDTDYEPNEWKIAKGLTFFANFFRALWD